MTDAGHQRFGLAGEGIAAPAGIAIAAITTVPADSDPLADRPTAHLRSERVDRADNLVSRHAGVGDPGEQPFLGDAVAVTDTAGRDLDPHLSGPGIGDIALDELERAFGVGDLGDAHLGHGGLPQMIVTMPEPRHRHVQKIDAS